MRCAAVDIGGANLKGATDEGRAASIAFALWREPERLAEVLAAVLEPLQPFDRLAATMTGELCDAYEDQADGVRSILAALERVAATFDCREPRVWTIDRRLVSLEEAAARPSRAAAANWLALAEWIAREESPHAGVLIDMGSTTTDIVRFEGGEPRPRAFEDPLRLAGGELVYLGSRRTPLCAILRETSYRGQRCALAAELFATSLDVWITLGVLPEDASARDTADGRPATRDRSRARLARMVCSDPATFTESDAIAIARDAARELVDTIERAIISVHPHAVPHRFVLSGSGEAVLRVVIEASWPGAEVRSISERHGDEISAAACAWAHARLSREREATR